MNISDINNLKNGDPILLDALVSDKRIGSKKDGNPYLILIIQDATGSISFPVWTEYDYLMEIINVNTVIKVKGVAGIFNNSIQIKNPIIQPREGEVDCTKFIPSYEIPEELIKYFNNTINSLEAKYKKFAIAATGAMGYNEKRWKAFVDCVAAEKFHGNKRGGLFLHTVGVMKTMEGIILNYVDKPFYMSGKNVLNKDRLILKCILHDIMKKKEYEYEGIIKRKQIKLDHIVMGAAYVQEINKELKYILSDEEADDISYSILAHHGEFGKFESKGVEDVLLNVADIIDSQIVNAIENKI